METKYVKVPFDIELAKKITNNEVEGRIITLSEQKVRIICSDRKDDNLPIVALVERSDGGENVSRFTVNGNYFINAGSSYDLVLEIPEYMTFNYGDVLIDNADMPFIYNGNRDAQWGYGYICGLNYDGVLSINEDTEKSAWTSHIKRHATEKEKQKLIEALKASKDPLAKVYLKRFFGIEEYEFTFKQDVLVRQNNKDLWCGAQFSHKELNHYVVFGGSYFLQCIPYNEKTSHLLGTALNE